MTPAVRRFLDLTGAAVPVVQAPMAGFAGADLAVAAMGAGAIGSLACATLDAADTIAQVAAIRARVRGPLNLNFFCHTLGEAPDDSAWRDTLAPFYAEEGVAPPVAAPALRRPFDAAMAAVVEQVRPGIVSFHFGLPAPELLARVRTTGALVFGNATTLAEARWLAAQGCDAIIAQGREAGGHAGHFLDGHHPAALATLLREIVDAVDVPVIAAGGIADESSARAAIALGAAAVQIGTAYLRTPESLASPAHRALLESGGPEETVFTNLFSGGIARGLRNRLIDALGPVHPAAPRFPYASAGLASLRAKAEREGRGDYSPLWAGQGLRLARSEPAADLTRRLGAAALAVEEQPA